MRLSPFDLLDGWLAPPPGSDIADWIGAQGFAHRGLHGPGLPENGPSAFAAAIARGLGIECDVQRSHDEQAVVFHDWELERLTGVQGRVSDRKASELTDIVLTGSADRIPTLPMLLDLIAGDVPILVEIKSKRGLPVAPLCRAVHAALAGYRGHHAVMSFDPRVGRWFARRSPETPRGLVVTEEGRRGMAGRLGRHLALWHARPHFLAYDIRDLPSRFAAAQRRRGLPLATWTVRSAEQRERASRHADAPIAEGSGIA